MIGKTASVAAQAYAASQYMAKTGSVGFADMLAGVVGSAADSGRKAEALAAQAAAGQKPELVDVVTAVAESEAALETLVAVRDKVVQAYDDIMRMPI